MPVVEVIADDLWEGEIRALQVHDTNVLLIKREGAILAYEDRCPHQKVPLSHGRIKDDLLVCSAHEWEFDVTTGKGVNPKCAHLRAFPVLCKNGNIYLSIPDNKPILEVSS